MTPPPPRARAPPLSSAYAARAHSSIPRPARLRAPPSHLVQCTCSTCLYFIARRGGARTTPGCLTWCPPAHRGGAALVCQLLRTTARRPKATLRCPQSGSRRCSGRGARVTRPCVTGSTCQRRMRSARRCCGGAGPCVLRRIKGRAVANSPAKVAQPACRSRSGAPPRAAPSRACRFSQLQYLQALLVRAPLQHDRAWGRREAGSGGLGGPQLGAAGGAA